MPRHLVSSTLVLALPLTLAACRQESPPDPRTEAPLVRAAAVEPSSTDLRSFTGTVAARIQSDLGFRVSGKVLERLVDTGQAVKRGQVLMRIDSADLELAVHAQQEAVAAAQARARQTSEEEARYRALRGTGAISASAYDQAKAAADAAQAQLSAAIAQARVAGNARRYAELSADADGVVIETLAEPGQVVATGQVVVRVAHAGQREAVIQLPETLRPPIGSTGQATLFGKEEMVGRATLRQLSDAADRLTRTFEARYVLDSKLADAPLGTTVVIRIPGGPATSQQGLRVPVAAVFDGGKGPGVWVIDGNPSTVHWRPVAVRHLEREEARIAGQLKEGDQVVALGAHMLREGERVRVAGQAAALAALGARP